MLDLSGLNTALADYLRGLLRRTLGVSPPFHDSIVALLGAKGLLLSERPATALPIGVLAAYAVLSGQDWRRALPAAAAVELAHLALEVYDKFLDAEGFSTFAPNPDAGMINQASCVQALSHHAACDLAGSRFAPDRVVGIQRTLSEMIVAITVGQEADTRVRRDWPGYDEAVAISAGKSAPLGATAGTVGAYLATERADLIDACAEFGRLAATRAQVINDLNDAMPAGVLKSDIRERRRTLPLVHLVRSNRQEYRAEIDLLRGTAPIGPGDEARIRRAVEASGAAEFTAVVADMYYGRALRALDPVSREFDTSFLVSVLLGRR